jgi:hypothetical protein
VEAETAMMNNMKGQISQYFEQETSQQIQNRVFQNISFVLSLTKKGMDIKTSDLYEELARIQEIIHCSIIGIDSDSDKNIHSFLKESVINMLLKTSQDIRKYMAGENVDFGSHIRFFDLLRK